MKILFIEFFLPHLLKDSDFPAGGWTNELRSWLEGLRQCDCKIGVLTWKGAGEYVGKEVGFDLIETYKPKTGIKFLRYFYVYLPALMKAAKEFAPDVIIQSSSGLETGMMGYIANSLHIPFVHRVASDRDADDRIYKTTIPFYAKLGYRYGLRQTTATICQNQYQHDSLKERYPEKQHYILHNPFTALQQLPIIKERVEKQYIAWVGIFKYEKNLPLLYAVARKLPDIQFKVAGMRSDHTDSACEAALAKLKILKNVELVGFVKRNNMFDFLNDALLLLSTSHYEGFSNVLLEAMAVGTPVAVPNRIDPDSIIALHQLGQVSEKDELLPKHVQQIVDLPPEQYHALACRCREYVAKKHDPVTKASAMLTILQELQSRYHA